MEETTNIVGLKGLFVAGFSERRSALGGGVSPFYERNVVSGWLELEFATAFAFIENESVVAFDLFFKKPFHVNETVNPYVGIGPNLTLIIEPAESTPEESTPRQTRVGGGILFAAGSYFWFGRDRFGIDAEVVYLLLFDDGLSHELGVELGPAFRF